MCQDWGANRESQPIISSSCEPESGGGVGVGGGQHNLNHLALNENGL